MIRARNKYGARKTVIDGVTFASAKEAARYAQLRTLERAGLVKGLILQPRFPLVVNGEKVCTYVGDFEYRDETGERVIEDVKGVKTDVYRIKNKLMRAVHNIEIRET